MRCLIHTPTVSELDNTAYLLLLSKGCEVNLCEKAKELGRGQTKVKEYRCAKVADDIEVSIKLDKESCATQSEILGIVLSSAIDGQTLVGFYGCYCCNGDGAGDGIIAEALRF
jgi:hypothetical protein